MLPKMEGSRVPGEDYFAIGSILLDIRSRMLPKRLFYAWIDTEVRMSKGVAACYMRIVRVFGDKYETLKHAPYTTLYELTYPSYPSSVIDKIEAGGYVPSLERIQEIRADRMILSSDAFLQELDAQLNLLQSSPSEIKKDEQQSIPPEVQRELEELRDDVKCLSDKCIRAEEERDSLVRSIKQLI
jgi:hypothetical protein